MKGFALRLSFLILALRLAAVTAAPPPYKAADFFLLNCAAPLKSTSNDGRDWDTDNHYLQFMPPNTAEISFPATTDQGPSVPQIPFTTARVFTSQLTYSFPVSSGQKFLRLYFFPANYSSGGGGGVIETDFFFSVTANNYTLVKNFSASLTVSAPDPFEFSPESYIKKEFVVNVDEKQQLNVTFSPSPNAYAFVNGIEIVSMPSNFYFRGDDYPMKLVGQNSNFPFDSSTSLETLHRLNVGGKYVGPKSDTGMFREWSVDDNYVVYPEYQTPLLDVPVYYTNETPAYTAPNVVYTTARTMDNNNSNGLFWLFPVDAGFFYLFRFYFCEFELEITGVNQRIFSIEMNNSTAEDQVDVFKQSGGHQIPLMKDYVIFVPDYPDRRRRQQNVSLSLIPFMKDKPVYRNAILNGLEIFKLNDSTGSLAVPNPELPATQSRSPEKKGKKKEWVAIIGGVVGGVVIVLLLVILGIFLIFRRRKGTAADPAPSVTKTSWVTMAMESTTTQKTGGSGGSRLPLDLCRHFSLEELKLATGNFNENFVIGRGGFGKVYRGYIDGEATPVAIKRLSPESSQGFREFQTEIQMLSKLRHLHLVSLIGYCDTDREMILVYDYMAQGTLRDHLYKSGKPPLPWKQRLQICIGAAKGLHYLHAGARHPIIHRDVKSTNILLDEKWVAKLSDFGLSKVGPLGVGETHVSTVVKGSFGYVDPEYYKRQQITEKSDVYSFGVVLFEVLCARPAVIPNLPRNRVSLAEWGRRSYESGALDQIVDPNLNGQIAAECLIQYVEIACNCLKDQGIDRPTMSDVVWGLEFALQLQDAADKRYGLALPPGTAGVPERPKFPLLGKDGGEEDSHEFTIGSKSNGTATSISDESWRGESHTIFSELSNQLGR